jgi:antitoxin PrlF
MNATLTSKGQVTVPKALRDYLGLKPGSAVEFDLAADGRVVIKPVQPDTERLAETTGRFQSVRGKARLGMSTDAYMNLLRGYTEDANDPGFRNP